MSDSESGFMPQNLSLFGRASLLVVLIELVTATNGFIRSVSKLVYYLNHDKTDFTHLYLAMFSIIIYSLAFMFNNLLYVGVRKGQVRWLRVWYKLGISILMLVGIVAIISAIADEDGLKSTSDLIIRVFEVWIVYEYCKELDRGYSPQTNSIA